MRVDPGKQHELKEWVSWALTVIREAAEPPLEKEEALGRAREIERLILARKISPSDVRLDEEFKEILYALVYGVLAEPHGSPEDARRRAEAVSEFILGLHWKQVDLEERLTLLKDCAAVAGYGGSAAKADSPEPLGKDPVEPPRGRSASAEEAAPLEKEARRVYESALPLIHSSFVSLHGLTEHESRKLERELLLWYTRFVQRMRRPPTNPKAFLVAAGRQLAEQYRRYGTLDLDSDSELGKMLEWALSEVTRNRAVNGKKGRGGSG
jgi:hypothetical protein